MLCRWPWHQSWAIPSSLQPLELTLLLLYLIRQAVFLGIFNQPCTGVLISFSVPCCHACIWSERMQHFYPLDCVDF
jgi:hypothetical protein